MDEITTIIAMAHKKATTPPEPRPAERNTGPQQRNLFASLEAAKKPAPTALETLARATASESATSICSVMSEKLKLANAKEDLSLGIGSTGKCKTLCNDLAKQCAAKHFKSSEDEAKLRTLLEQAGISSNARKAHVVLSILLQALATREIEIHGEDPLLE